MSASDIAIRVENLGKMYHIGRQRQRSRTFRGRVKQLATAPFDWLTSQIRGPSEEETLWALRDVSFEVKRGEVLGIIGRNGAGKSTLLKVLSRITEPTEGRVDIYGRVGALLEVGTGMHPELTGRENVYLNGCILGMRRFEINRKFDEIVEFSGISKFIDTPVKRYSSGMRVRLGFAIAAHLEPEILLVDEVLAVGDAEFQRRCLGKMKDVAGHGRTVLFVSHNMSAVLSLCGRSLLVQDGMLEASGSSDRIVASYLGGAQGDPTDQVDLAVAQCRDGDGVLRIVDYAILDKDGHHLDRVMCGQDIVFVLRYVSQITGPHNVRVCINIYDSQRNWLSILNSHCVQQIQRVDLSESGEFRCEIPRFPLLSGSCSFSFWVLVDDRITDLFRGYVPLPVVDGDYFGTGINPSSKCVFFTQFSWSHSSRGPEQ